MTRILLFLLAWVVSLTPLSAASLRSFFISPGAMNVYPIYRDDVLVPGLLQKASDSSLRLGFSLPADYATGTTVTVRLMLGANTLASACSGMFGVLYLDRARIGYRTYETSQPNFDGMFGGATGAVSFPANGKVIAKNFSLAAPKNGPFTGIQAGDNVVIWLKRYATNGLDTCDFVTVYGADVRYTAQY